MAKSDKTEKPTPKKLRESRQKGQIAKSQDLSSWMAVLVGLYLVPLTLRRIADVVAGAMYGLREVPADATPDAAVASLAQVLRDGFLAATPLMLVGAAAALVTTMAQTGPLLSLKPLKPDFKRVNPKNGFQRLFSMRSLWETVKQVLKVTVILAMIWPDLTDLFDTLVGRGRIGLVAGLSASGDAVLSLVRTVAWTMMLIAAADYGYQKYQHRQDLKMTKQEVRDEYKNTEGDAMVKGRMRSLQRSMARNRMIADMGNADVVITNPTHIAVALRYDPERGGAPQVVATGAGEIAARIRARAGELDIPMVEAKPLARALWRACEVGDEVPVALYEAVAKVLVFVRTLDRRLRRSNAVDLPRAASVDDAFLESIPHKRRRRRPALAGVSG